MMMDDRDALTINLPERYYMMMDDQDALTINHGGTHPVGVLNSAYLCRAHVPLVPQPGEQLRVRQRQLSELQAVCARTSRGAGVARGAPCTVSSGH